MKELDKDGEINEKNFPFFYPIYAIFQIIVSIALFGFITVYFIYNHSSMVNIGSLLLILIPYLGIVASYTFYIGLLGLIQFFKKKSLNTLEILSIESKLSRSPYMVIFHIILGILIIISFLFMVVFNYLQSISLFAPVVVFTVLTMVGYSLIYFISSINYILKCLHQKIKNLGQRQKPRILPGLMVLSFLSLLIIPGYFIISFINNPQLASGINRQVDLFVGGEDGYNTYRIPSLLIIPQGSTLNNSDLLEDDLILAICEGRRYSAIDDGEVDIVMKRSKNGGKDWSDMKVIVDSGSKTDLIRHCDPMVVFDNTTGIIFMFYRYITYENEFIARPGMNRKEVLTFLTYSKNGGIDWSDPEELDLRPPSPGHGIQLKYGPKAGRLVVTSYAGAIYSDDQGKTWYNGEKTSTGGECEVVETIDGKIYITLRKNKPLGQLDRDYRQYAWSEDSGESWGKVKEEQDLPTPICMASICRYTDNFSHEKSRILFSNPADYINRAQMTIKLSYDECESWEVSKLLYEGPSGYSEVAVHSDGTMVCFFERGQFGYSDKITYTEFDIDWLTDGEDQLNSK